MAANRPARPDTALGRFLGWRDRNREASPRLGGELSAMFREGVKEVRGVFHQFFFSSPEAASEPGTPLSPTQIMTTNDLLPGQFGPSGHPNSYDRAIDAHGGSHQSDRDRTR